MKLELVKNYSTFSLASMATGSGDEGGGGKDNGGFRSSKESMGRLSITDMQDENSKQESPSVSTAFRNLMSQCCKLKTLTKSFPILDWAPKYSFEKLMADIIAAITVTITMLPQGLAYATIGDLPPEVGLWSCFVGCIVHFFVGGAPQVIVGPTAILAILVNTYTEEFDRSCYVMLTLLTGIMSFTLGVFKLGFIVNFISKPVSSAFTSAAALTICSTQFKEALGLKFQAQGFTNVLAETANRITETKMPDLFLSVGCIAVLIFLRHLPQLLACVGLKINPVFKFISIARNAIVVISTTAFVFIFSSIQPFTVVQEIKSGLPPFQPPPLSVYSASKNQTFYFIGDVLEREGSAIIVLPLLALMEHISVAKALAGDSIVDASQELVSQGLSNIIGSFFSNMPITGSFSLTTVNSASGARTPASGLITGGLVLLAIQYMASYFSYIPKSSLAAVIICAVIYMVDLGIVISMWKSKKMELVPWFVTASISLFVGLEYGMMTGFLISVTYLLYYAARPGVKVKRGYTNNATEFVLLELDRSLTFPSVEYIRYILIKASTSCGKNKLSLVIDCHHIQFTDFTAAQGLTDLINQFKKKDTLVVLWRAKPSVARIMRKVDKETKMVKTEAQLEEMLDAEKDDDHGIQIQVTSHVD